MYSQYSINRSRVLQIKIEVETEVKFPINIVTVTQSLHSTLENFTYRQTGGVFTQLILAICSMYSDKGTLIIMGDFNAHRNGRVFLKGHDRRSNLLQQFLTGNNFVAINTLPLCTGASSTYVSYSGEYTSMIDHILIQIEKTDLVSMCKVLDDDALMSHCNAF